DVMASVPDLLAAGSDVLALVQHLLASVAGAVVPITQLQSELASFLFGSTGVEPVPDARGRIDSAALSTAGHAWVASELPLLRALASFPDVPVAGIAPWSAPLAGIAPTVFCATTQACDASALPGMAVQLVLRSSPSELPPTG